MPREWSSPKSMETNRIRNSKPDENRQSYSNSGKYSSSNPLFVSEIEKESTSSSSDSGSNASSSEACASSARCSGNFRKTENESISCPKPSSETSSTKSVSSSKGFHMGLGAVAGTGNTDKKDTGDDVNPEDLYCFVSKFEEDAARNMKEDSCLEAYLDCCDELEVLMTEMYKFRRNTQTKEEIRALRQSNEYLEIAEDCTVVMADIRRHSRYFKLKIKDLKDDLLLQRQNADKDQLKLRQVIFEAIQQSNQYPAVDANKYKSIDGEIDLIPLEDFFKEAPASLVQEIEFNPDKLWLARLEHEYMHRKQLTDQCEELEKVEQKLANEIDAQKRKVDQVEPILSNLLETAIEPVLATFDPDLPPQWKFCEGADYLPNPLYRLYVFSVGFQEFLGTEKFKVQLHSNIAAARKLFNRQQAEIVHESDSKDSDSDDVIEPEYLAAEIRKSLKLKRKENEIKKLVEINPLSVHWIITTGCGKSMTVQFQYMTKLKIVCVNCSLDIGLQSEKKQKAMNKKAQKILINLYAQDTGVDSPNPSTYFHLRKAGIDNFSKLVKNIGRPYKWAQKLCGLEFPVMLTESDDDVSLIVKPLLKPCNATIEDINEQILKRLKYHTFRRSELKRVREISNQGIPI